MIQLPFYIEKTMLKFSIITKNIFLEKAITELIKEIASTKTINDFCFQYPHSNNELKNSDLIITEMEVGEYFLCQNMEKNQLERPIHIILAQKEITVNTYTLPLCIQEAILLYKKINIDTISKVLSTNIDELVTGKRSKIPKDKKRCLRCPHQRLSESQMKVINSVYIGLNNHQTAQMLGISHKTVYSHKSGIMKKFKLETHQELIRLSSIIMEKMHCSFH